MLQEASGVLTNKNEGGKQEQRRERFSNLKGGLRSLVKDRDRSGGYAGRKGHRQIQQVAELHRPLNILLGI